MLTKLTIRNFKLFDEVGIELGRRVVLVGPNNTGKTSTLQALALWEIGAKRWLERRRSGNATGKKQRGVAINRRDLTTVPVPTAKMLWRDLRVRRSRRENGKPRTDNVLMEVVAEGVGWNCGLEFDYANEESFYCRPLRQDDKTLTVVPEEAGKVRIAYLPPMSGLAANEIRLEQGTINVRLGEGRTAEVLRNLCYQIATGEDGEAKWGKIVEQIEKLFGSRLDLPEYISERGEITLTYRTKEGVRLDLSASGSGEQQTLLLLAYLAVNPGAVLLLDEPDAHLWILRQRQIYNLISDTAEETNSQIIAASHSEVIMNEAAGRDVLVSFAGKPHRVDNRSEQKQVLNH